METGSSVSKGVFAYKGKKKSVNPEKYFPKSETVNTWKRRLETYQSLWESVDTEIQILQSDLNTKIFDDLLKFTKTCHSRFTLSSQTGDSRTKEIPTAALVTGVNTPDHGVMFATLVTLLQERVSPLVAILQSKDCNNVKNTLSKLLGQILKNPQLFEDDEDSPEVNQKNLPISLATLADWYDDKYTLNHSSPKKRKSEEGDLVDIQILPPVIMVFEDLESFQPRVLQEFITICSNYLSQLPIVFVFGIATSVSAVHRLLPNAVSSTLCMEKFQAPPSTEYLTLLINQILMTKHCPFKLGSRVFKLLLDIFLYHDFSVLNFIKGLQFSMMDHFLSNPMSQLCCPLEELPNQTKRMNSDELELIRQLPSFMRYVESCSLERQAELLTDDAETKIEVLKLVTEIHTYREEFYPILRCLHTLVSKLPKQPLGKQLREVYATVLGWNMEENEDYQISLDLLKFMSKDELIGLLRGCGSCLGNDLPSSLKDIPVSINSLLDRFDTLHEQVEEDEEETTDSPVIQKTDLHSLKKRLQELEKKKKKLSPYEKLRTECVDYFDSLFRKYLVSPKALPLHELLYYDSASTVRSHLTASPRAAVQLALGSSHTYLRNQTESDNSGTISPDIPDVCIVYKLHMECSQLINLYDWLQAFITVKTSNDEENDDQVKNPDQVLQARFIRAVSELQFLGFVKPTKRKTDHVARLTWGGC
ncbi:origin recognition complex subunit 3-like [Mizuhopecten yessoensis]|uniref:Origin recognition complex subunit 3 n=1 Tax=Mizuhopecten yessoensis TaxID=6573 RepID=A0A210QFR9_MIZYE|nr:origin recognition complex subunit 3-like [Mizuhopecten yessoensis]OWF47585.1 Origin recognition complex subunit 3 [Mizuhopecten yessoensis]